MSERSATIHKGSTAMDRRSARSRLIWAVALGAVLAGAAAGLVCAAERGEIASPVRSEASESYTGLEIITPEPGAKLRGVARVEVEWPNPHGYLIFRVDDKFVYATRPPFEMRWDTSNAPDGKHMITVDAYDSSARYAGTSSITVTLENSIPTPPEGVLLAVRFDDHDLLSRRISARGELETLREGEVLPQGFEVLSGEFRGELTQSILETFYDGPSALVRNRLRTASLVVEGTRRNMSELGLYAIVQVSPNGLTLPEASGGGKPRLGVGEISSGFPDYPVLPGDTWQKPLGVVCDLYSRRAIFVQANHTFEGLRWFRGHECAVVTSSYRVSELPILTQSSQYLAAAGDPGSSYVVELTQMGGRRGGMGGRRGGMGGRGRGGGMGMRGGMSGGQRGTRAPGGAAGRAPGRAAAGDLQSVRLVDLGGTRRTYLTRETGRILHIEDTILGKVEFRVSGMRTASGAGATGYDLALTAMGGGRGMRGGGRGGMRGGGMRGGARRGAASQALPGTGARPGAGQAGAQIPQRLNYGFQLTTDLVSK